MTNRTLIELKAEINRLLSKQSERQRVFDMLQSHLTSNDFVTKIPVMIIDVWVSCPWVTVREMLADSFKGLDAECQELSKSIGIEYEPVRKEEQQ